MSTGIPFPDISPVIFSVELFGLTLALRWYALAYIVGIIIGWWVIRLTIGRLQLWREDGPPINREHLENLVTWIVIGVIAGGRLGFVLFYQPAYFLAHPAEIPMIWTGGMSFHGGFLGVIIAVWMFARKHGLATASLADLLALGATPAILLVRGANFINAELWGRPTDMPWGVIFPGAAAQFCPGVLVDACARHPSQLYQALLEGALLGAILLYLAWRRDWLKRPGMLTGLFFLGYGVARFMVEFVRQPDALFITPGNPVGYALQMGGMGLTMGQILSLPVIIVGVATLIWARKRATKQA